MPPTGGGGGSSSLLYFVFSLPLSLSLSLSLSLCLSLSVCLFLYFFFILVLLLLLLLLLLFHFLLPFNDLPKTRRSDSVRCADRTSGFSPTVAAPGSRAPGPQKIRRQRVLGRSAPWLAPAAAWTAPACPPARCPRRPPGPTRYRRPTP